MIKNGTLFIHSMNINLFYEKQEYNAVLFEIFHKNPISLQI